MVWSDCCYCLHFFLSCAITLPVVGNYSIHITCIYVWNASTMRGSFQMCPYDLVLSVFLSFSRVHCIPWILSLENLLRSNTLDVEHHDFGEDDDDGFTCAYKPPTHKKWQCSLSCTEHIHIYTRSWYQIESFHHFLRAFVSSHKRTLSISHLANS